MIVLIVFAFLAGLVTILSPCILPILPIILSSVADDSGKRRPFGVIVGFVISFTFFTLFLSSLVRLIGVSPEALRYFSIIVLAVFGFSLLSPKTQNFIEKLFAKLSNLVPITKQKYGFFGGLIVGLSLGLLWTPCVGPILASVISLAISGTVSFQAFIITIAYSMGTAVPMFFIMIAGSTALRKIPWLVQNSQRIQMGFGLVMILTALSIIFNLDRGFQTYILNKFPNYGVGLTNFENNDFVKSQIEKINQKPTSSNQFGKPMSDLLPKGPPAPEIVAGGEWFNTTPLTLSSLRGKVVLIDFWTYTCINCQRTLPYLKSWWEKYKDKGLVIIGVHSPEFEFEKNSKNVQKALKDFGITYPVVQDNNFGTWGSFGNNAWPAKYFIDKDGFVRDVHIGEGSYDESEKTIQKLLNEAGSANATMPINNPNYAVYSKTPETYLGYQRIAGLASPETLKTDKSETYSKPDTLRENKFAFQGVWNVMGEYANPSKGSKLFFNFDSKEVFLVMRNTGKLAKVKVYLDDKLINLGEDATNGVVTVDSDRLYKLIKLDTPGRHLLRIEFLDNNAELYAFTFG